MARRKKNGVVDADFRIVEGPPAVMSFDAAPTPEQMPNITPDKRAFLRERMLAIVAAQEFARQRALQLAQGYTVMNTALIAAVFGPGVAFASGLEGKTAVINFFKTIAVKMVQNASEGVEDVLAGRRTFDHWLNARKVDAQGMARMLVALGDNSVGENLLATLRDAANDVTRTVDWVQQKAEDVRQNLPSVNTVLYVGLALGALVLYQYLMAPLRFLPSRKTAGYLGLWAPRPRRTRRRRLP